VKEKERIMSALPNQFFASNPTAFALNRKANQVAQTNPALAAELRLLAYKQPMNTFNSNIGGKKQSTAKSAFGMNRKANRVARTQPALAAQLRFQAAYA
jgi:hypothetical protein